MRIKGLFDLKRVWLICNKIMEKREKWILDRKKSENGHEWDKKYIEIER